MNVAQDSAWATGDRGVSLLAPDGAERGVSTDDDPPDFGVFFKGCRGLFLSDFEGFSSIVSPANNMPSTAYGPGNKHVQEKLSESRLEARSACLRCRHGDFLAEPCFVNFKALKL